MGDDLWLDSNLDSLQITMPSFWRGHMFHRNFNKMTHKHVENVHLASKSTPILSRHTMTHTHTHEWYIIYINYIFSLFRLVHTLAQDVYCLTTNLELGTLGMFLPNHVRYQTSLVPLWSILEPHAQGAPPRWGDEDFPAKPWEYLGCIHPGKQICPLKRDYFNRNYIFQPLIFRGYVSFQGGIADEWGWNFRSAFRIWRDYNKIWHEDPH